MGSDDVLAKEREKPLHEVHINYDIAMAKRPVTVEEYMLFAQATGAEVPEERHEHLGFENSKLHRLSRKYFILMSVFCSTRKARVSVSRRGRVAGSNRATPMPCNFGPAAS